MVTITSTIIVTTKPLPPSDSKEEHAQTDFYTDLHVGSYYTIFL